MAAQTTPVCLGVIGGSGLYEIEGLSETERIDVRSPFGTPSDSLLLGRLAGTDMVFLPRHGRGHPLPPSAVDYRANIDALKRAGVTDIVSLSAVGSLKDDIAPGDFVLVDQFIDRTFAREKSFFGAGLAAHVSMAEPVCPRLGDHLLTAGESLGLSIVRGGTYLAMEGTAVLDRRRIGALSPVGLLGHRHDQHAGGQARPRGGDLLRDRRHGDGLRLLAPGSRRRHGRSHRADVAGERGSRPPPAWRRLAKRSRPSAAPALPVATGRWRMR